MTCHDMAPIPDRARARLLQGVAEDATCQQAARPPRRYTVWLQNAWSPQYAGRTWPRPAWLHALARSRSGQRLRLLVDDLTCCYNTTPRVGATPGSILPPDLAYIRDVLAAVRPEIVIVCGRQAEQALPALWEGPLLAVPHPAARVLTNALYERARMLITFPYTGRYALRQRRGTVLLVPLRP